MKIIIGLMFLFMTSTVLVHAQAMTTVETKVILAVEAASEGITQVVLFNTFEQMNGKEIFKKYPNCQFYIGLLQGRYEVKEDRVLPSKGSTVIMYTEYRYLSDNSMLHDKRTLTGNQLDLGTGKTKVVSNSKGELILEAL